MKINHMLRSLVPALLLAMATPALIAADAAADAKTPAERREEFKKLTPEERAAKIKERKEKMDARLAALQKKKADGSITAPEEKQLNRLEAWKKNQGVGGDHKPHARKPAGDKPAGTDKP